MKRAIASAAAVLAVVAVVVGLWFARRPPLVHLRIGTAPQIISSPLQVALASGDFADQRLDVEIVPFSSGRRSLDALLNGQVDIATVAETPLWNQVLEQRPLVLWTTLAETRRSVWIIARGDAGVRSPADVAGKRVLVPRGTTAEIYLLAFLDLYGIPRGGLDIHDCPPEDVGRCMAAGEADVACIWEPFASKVEAGLDHPVIMHDDFIYRMTWNLVGRRDAPALPIERVLRALDKANRRMLTPDPRVVDEVARWCQLAPDQVRRALPDYHFALQLEGSLLTEIEEQVKLLRGRDAVPPDILGMIDPVPLSRVRSDAISIPRGDAR